jgi:alkanesulfonate monooxygenase SsuD/methylene tetrahydromethanopterin reductase-like flavin-dependent oxidoreductase (luciferase family)
MTLGLMLPTTVAGARGADILTCARLADQGGLHSVWVIDRLVFPLFEPVATLAAVASVTSQVKLGTNVLIEPCHEPTLLAAQLATVDVLSNGRVMLGVGVGSREEDYSASGRDFHTRGRRLEADTQTLRGIWAGESVVAGFGPTGLRPINGTIPIIFGGSSERAMDRAARIGDGFACVPRGVARHAEQFEKFRALWAKHHRRGKPFLLANGYYCVDENPERARANIGSYLQHYYGTRPRASGGTSVESEWDLVGPPQAIAEAAARYLALGPDVLVLAPVRADPRQVEALAGPITEQLSAVR